MILGRFWGAGAINVSPRGFVCGAGAENVSLRGLVCWCWGVVSFKSVLVLGLCGREVRLAWLVGGENGVRLAQHEQDASTRPMRDVRDQLCTGTGGVRHVQGEFCTGSGAVRLVQGEFCLAVAPPLFTVAGIPLPAGTADRACRLRDGFHAGDRGGFAALGAGCRRVAGVSDL